MKITITARKTQVPPLAEQMLRTKADRLERFGHKITSVHAIFGKEKYLFTAELTLAAKGASLVSRAKHKSDLLTCIEEAVSKLETQLERLEDKKVDEVRRRTVHRPA